MKKADIDEDTDIFHLIIVSESASQQDSQFEQLFKTENFDVIQNIAQTQQISQLSAEKITEINDVHRMIKNKVKYFKTQFVRYNSKKDTLLDKEVTMMLSNLKDHGTKNTAKTKSVENQVKNAIKNFRKIRDANYTDMQSELASQFTMQQTVLN